MGGGALEGEIMGPDQGYLARASTQGGNPGRRGQRGMLECQATASPPLLATDDDSAAHKGVRRGAASTQRPHPRPPPQYTVETVLTESGAMQDGRGEPAN